MSKKIAIEIIRFRWRCEFIPKMNMKTTCKQILGQIDKENKEILLSGISAEAKVVGYYDLNIKVNGDKPDGNVIS
jgi:hypothetical protein